MKRYLILFLFSLLTVPSGAQIMTHGLERRINGQILTLIENYEQESLALESGYTTSFLDLFVSPSAPVWCDYMGSPAYGTKVPASDYADYAAAGVRSAAITLKDISKGRLHFQDGMWQAEVHLSKSQEFMDGNEILFSSTEYYGGKDYELTLTVVYNEEEDRCQIRSIDGVVDSDKPFPSGFYQVIQKNETATEQLYASGQPLQYNSFGQAFNTEKLTSRNDDVTLRKRVLSSNERYEYVTYDFVPRIFRARFRYGFTLGGAYHFTTSESFSSLESKASEMGLDLGVAIGHSGRTSWALYTGAALSNSSISIENRSVAYEYEAADAMGYTYQRAYRIQSAAEALQYQDIAVPLYLSMEAGLASFLRLTMDVGVKGYYNWKTSYTPYHVKATVSGRSKVDKFDDIDADFTRFIDPGKYNRRVYDLSAVGSAGLDIRLYKILSVYGKVSYEYGIFESFTSDNKYWISEDSGEFPLVYNPIVGEEVARRSFIKCISFSRRALWLNVGLMMKF